MASHVSDADLGVYYDFDVYTAFDDIKLDDEDDDLLLPEPDFQDMHEDVALFCVCKVSLTGDMLPCAGGACEGKW